jgi:hemoglobin
MLFGFRWMTMFGMTCRSLPYHEGHRFHPCWRRIVTQLATSLYQRMGGYDVIAAVIDDLFAILHGDPAFARFFGGRSEDSVIRSRQLLVDQMCALSGGPCRYIGRDMKTSHRGLGITNVEWETNMKASDAALAKNGVDDAERTEFLALFERYRDDIVEA